MIILSRWEAIKVAFKLFQFATGTSKIGITIDDEGLSLLGKNVIEEEKE